MSRLLPIGLQRIWDDLKSQRYIGMSKADSFAGVEDEGVADVFNYIEGFYYRIPRYRLFDQIGLLAMGPRRTGD